MKRTSAVCRVLALLTLVHGLWGQSVTLFTPIISSFNPASVPAGGNGFFLTINGQLFQGGMSVRFTPAGSSTTTVLFPSSGLCDSGGNCQTDVFIPSNLITTAGNATIVLRNGDSTGVGAFRDSTPASYPLVLPSITSLSPPSRTAGRPAFTLTVNGANFTTVTPTGCTSFCPTVTPAVNFGANSYASTFVDSGQLTVTIPATDITTPGNITVTVDNPGSFSPPNRSNQVTFTVLGMPTVTSVTPVSHTAGNGSVVIQLTGTNFVNGDAVYWDAPTTQFAGTVSGGGTVITATVPAGFMTSPSAHTVGVYRLTDGATSNSVPFTVNGVPVISVMTPTSKVAGSPAFVLTVSGGNYISNEVIVWTGSSGSTVLTTRFLNVNNLEADVPASLVANAGTAGITVRTIDNVSSNSQTFTITSVPAITNMSPNPVTAGHATFVLTVTGTGFQTGAIIRWNGADQVTTPGGGGIQTTISSTMVSSPGTVNVTVANPDGGVSPPATFTILPAPTITSLSPTYRTAGSPGFTLTVNGTNFSNTMVVRWNGANRTTTFVSPTQLTINVPATDVTAPAFVPITVVTSDGVSTPAATFPIYNPPNLTVLSPSSITAGAPPFDLNVSGSFFRTGDRIRFNGTLLTTTLSNNQCVTALPSGNLICGFTLATATIPTALIMTPGTVQVGVFTVDGVNSANTLDFVINPAPVITNLNPSSVTAGHSAFTLTVTGTNVPSGSIVQWNGANQVTSSPSAGVLTINVPQSFVASPGTVNITIFTPDGVQSAASPFTILPAPTITSLSPTYRTAGAPGFTLTVNGTNLTGGTVRWNGANRTTTPVSSTQLTINVPGTDIAAPGYVSITVLTSDGVSSAPAPFQVATPPTLSSLNPTFITAGAPGFTLTVNAAPGSIFRTGDQVRFAGTTLPTALSSPQCITDTPPGFTYCGFLVATVTVPATLITTAGTVPVGVLTADGVSSANSLNFVINPSPVITSLNPNSVRAGSPGFTLQVLGSNFTNAMTVRWNGSNLSTTFVSATRLDAAVTASLVTSPGTANVTVAVPDGYVSGPSVFTIIQPPTITSLVPNFRTAGASDFTLTVNGTTFDSGSTVRWNGTSIPTTFVSATQLTAQVSASLIASPGSVNVTVAPASGTVSAAAVFTILPTPVLTSINPTSAVAGGPTFSLIATGANFTNTMTVLWNGSPLSTTFNSSTQLTATVPASLLIAGTASVTVTSADGVVTAPRTFTIFPRLLILTTSLPEGVTGRLYGFALSATGGVQPYTWSAQGLPPGYSINSSTGSISGIIQTAGTFSVSVTLTDTSGQTATASYTLIVKQAEIPLEILTGSVPPGQASVAYATSFSARGGTPPYTFSMSNGSLPAGLTLAGDGSLFGTPTTFGRFPFTVRVNDTAGNSASRDFLLVIAPPPLVLTGGVSDTTVGSPISAQFGAIGGVPPYTFGVSGALPSGTSFANGLLSGTATTVGTFQFTVSVTDSTGTVTTKAFTIKVEPALLRLTGSAGNGQVNLAYTAQFGGEGGVPPYTFSATGLPPGIQLSGTSLTGTPTTEGTFNVAVTVTDSTGTKATRNFSVVIGPVTLVITTSSLPAGTVGAVYSVTLAATGGVLPLTWSISGAPDGLSAAGATLSGTPTLAGTFTVNATVTDAAGTTASRSFSLTISPPPLTITTGSLPNPLVGAPYTTSVGATGGVPPYTFTVGGAPAGISLSSAGVFSGAATTPGPATISVTVRDSTGATASQSYTVTVGLPTPPAINVTGLPPNSNPGTQPGFQLGLGAPFPGPVTVTATLTFTPDSGADDPAVQFAGGGRTMQLTIPAGSTTATNVQVQTGTVAGTITITFRLSAFSNDVTPTPVPVRTIRVNPTPPVITSLTAARNATGLTVTISGFSSSREIQSANFTFSAAPGSTVQTTQLTVPVDAMFAQYFGSAAAAPFGSQFTFTQPFTIQQGSSQSIASITVTLTSRVGTSAPATANVQ